MKARMRSEKHEICIGIRVQESVGIWSVRSSWTKFTYYLNNQTSVLQYVKCLDGCVDELLKSSCLRGIYASIYICSPFSVIKRNIREKLSVSLEQVTL